MKQKIFITGASKGIGLAIARKFFNGGFEVMICARGEQALQTALEEMPGIHTYQCDIADKEAAIALCQEIRDQFGPLDILVNNGGQYVQTEIHTATPEQYHSLMRTNVDSAFYFSRELIPPMKKRGKGSVFMMASVASLQAYPNGGLYGMSKYALMGMAKNLRLELTGTGVRIITLFPGAVQTPSWEHLQIPKEQFIPPEDIAELVWTAYHLSERSVVEDIVIRPEGGDI